MFNAEQERKKEMFYLTMHSTHFICDYMVSDIWYRTSQIAMEETCCHHFMGYSFRLAERDLLYAPSHRHTMTIVASAVEHSVNQEMAEWVHHEGSI